MFRSNVPGLHKDLGVQMRLWIGSLLILAAIGVGAFQDTPPLGVGPLQGRLYRMALGGSSSEPLRAVEGVPSQLRARATRFLKCHADFTSLLRPGKEFFAAALAPRQRAIEQAIACLMSSSPMQELE
jgi:hypothetical protein